jgi:hypothetical protein
MMHGVLGNISRGKYHLQTALGGSCSDGGIETDLDCVGRALSRLGVGQEDHSVASFECEKGFGDHSRGGVGHGNDSGNGSNRNSDLVSNQLGI